MADKNFQIKNGLTVGTTERISSAGQFSGSLASATTATTQAASDNSTKIATTAYTTTAISNLVESSPSTLNTLNELAAALGDDANFSTTVTNSIATKLPLAGGTMSGALNMGSQNITNANRLTLADGITDTGQAGSATVFNESGSTADFRIESDSNTHMFFLDAGQNSIGINQSQPSSTYALDVGGQIRSSGNSPGFNLREDDSSNQHWQIGSYSGAFAIRNVTGSSYPLQIGTNQHATFSSRIVPGEHIIFSGSTGYLQFPTNSGSQAWAIGGSGGGANPGVDRGDLGIHYWSGSAWSNAFMIDGATGNVGIGNSSPADRLVVQKDTSNIEPILVLKNDNTTCLLYTSPSPRDKRQSRMPSSA